MCEEMVKLRKELDARSIEWKDASDKLPEYVNVMLSIDRTHFNYKGKFYSVINGFGTYGGKESIESRNEGLLEVMIDHDNDPKGWLTAEDILQLIGVTT